jgi:hypothetical protein
VLDASVHTLERQGPVSGLTTSAETLGAPSARAEPGCLRHGAAAVSGGNRELL